MFETFTIVSPKHGPKQVLVDKEDLYLLEQHKWHVWEDHGRGIFYVRRTKRNAPQGYENYLARLIVGAKKGDVVDHINGNTLDNRKENLRVTTQSRNGLNRRGPNKNNKSGALGVVKRWNKYYPYIRIGRKQTWFGGYDTLDEAVAVRATKLEELLGEKNV
jgi:hypothetical protein